jgi:5-(carboxyamino)imidazole ribonucleotide mutase
MSKRIAVIMGSSSDLKVMQEALDILSDFNVEFDVSVVSAHRTPVEMLDFAKTAASKGIKVIIAAAGGAAHLPGMVASATDLPVIGVPINSSNSIDGWDSLLSIAQMPKGVPVATMAIDGAQNSALMALKILATADNEIAGKLTAHRESLREKVKKMNSEL